MQIEYKPDYHGGTFHITSENTKITEDIAKLELEDKSKELFKLSLEVLDSSTDRYKITTDLILDITEKTYSESMLKELYESLKETFEPEA